MKANELAAYGISKIGTPYFYGSKMRTLTFSFMESMHKAYPKVVTMDYINKARKKSQVGKINVDCSGLISSFTNKTLGSAQLYQKAYTRLPISEIENFAIGTVLWKSGHVGIYIGKENGVPMCVEAKGIDYGTIKSKVSSTKWQYGLTFSWLDYDYTTNLSSTATWKQQNPYTEPEILVCSKATGINKNYKEDRYKYSGEEVKWVQFELNEAGCVGKDGKQLKVDGEFGPNTEYALIQFQKSCKIEADGICGKITRVKLKEL